MREQLLSVNPSERFDRFQLYKDDPLHDKIRSETRIEAFSTKVNRNRLLSFYRKAVLRKSVCE